jgi:solute carrier family 10 (sodium/bile acid cotransporter), member 3/5
VDIIFRVFITIFVVTITFTMGATLDSKIIWNYCKRPLAPAIGFLCQYLIMPLTSFALCYIIPIDKVIGFGLLTIGCCPGGGASNIWTVLLRGDLNLSMTMTFLSTVAAFGMMPMWLYLLGGFFIESKVQIPYGQIAVNMLMVVLPALGGMAVKWRSDFIAQKLGRTTQPLAIVFLIFIMTFGTYVHWPIYTVLGDQPIVLLCASLLPLLGFVFGGLFAFVILRSSYPQVIAISLETGIQNIGIAMVVLLYSMPQPYGAMGAIVPIAVSIFSPIPLVALLGIMRCYDRFRKTSDKSVE